MQDVVLYIAAGVAVAVVAIAVMVLVRHGGWRGAMFGARVLRELGEVGGQRTAFSRRLRAKVFLLEDDGGAHRFGLELRNHGKRSYATLDAADARRLAELLLAGGR